jgi:multisubunit Na+/H+ antiporter MnhE subunit
MKTLKKIGAFLADVSGEIFTFLGLFIAWIFTTGAAKVTVGKFTLGAVLIWAIAWPLRNRDSE